MGKLPADFVRAPTFDSPLRRTSLAVVEDDTELEATEEPAAVTEAVATAEASAQRDPTPSPDVAHAMPKTPGQGARQRKVRKATEASVEQSHPHRMTIRFSNDAWQALQRERHERTLAGDKNVSASELVREIVDAWAKRKARRE